MDNELPEGYSVEEPASRSPASVTQSPGSLPEGYSVDQAPQEASHGSTDLPEGYELDEDKFGTPTQKAITAVEGFGQGLVGPIAPLIERGLGVKPENIRLRAETNPVTHGVPEAIGFGAGMLSGTGEAALVGKAGEAVSGALQLGGEGASIGSRLAAGATKAATELGLMQSGDEATKAITEDPDQTIGSAAANVGLSTLLGGVGGGLLTGVGAAAKTGIDALGLKEFSDRLAFRGANADPNEMLKHEAESAYNTYKNMGSELTGANGLKAQAIKAVLPETITPEISGQVQDLFSKGQSAIEKMAKEDVPERYINKFSNDLNRLQEVVTNQETSVSDHFDALNEFKSTLQDYSKGNYGPFAVPRYHEAYDFLNITKNLGRDVRTALEDSKVWGDAADLQKNINSAWSTALPAVKDFEKKFMTKVGNELVIDPAKFQTYLNQSGKATSQTIRQQMMGKFVDAVEKFSNATGDAYEKAGIPNPHAENQIGMGMLKESLGKQSVGARLADLWYDKLGAQSLGAGVGALAGNAIMPGLGGAFIGKEVLGPVFGAIIQPIVEKATNLSAYQQAMKFGKSVLAGNNQLIKASANLFEGGAKTIPSHLYADNDKVSALNEKLADLEKHPQKMLEVSGNLGHYAPNHAESLAKTTMGAVNYLNSQRPRAQQLSPLDSKIEPTRAQKDDFNRTLSIAQNPLTVMGHIKNGTLLPSDVKTLASVYPAYYKKMSQEIMNSLMNHVSEGKTIPYHIRQSCSLFLGQPLDSTMTPQAIQSIQSIYMNKQSSPQSPPVTKNKRNTSKLGDLASNLKTQNQKAESRHSVE